MSSMQISVQLGDELIAKVDAYAARTNRDRSKVVREALERLVAGRELVVHQPAGLSPLTFAMRLGICMNGRDITTLTERDITYILTGNVIS